MSNQITSTDEMAESAWDGQSEPDETGEDIVATKGPEGDGIEFHVSMRRYTKQAMDDLIVEAAAQLIVGRHNKNEFAKVIEQRCIQLLSEKANEALSKVTTEIIDQPLTPSFGDNKPVTMREFIGLTGREYLSARVGPDGKVATDSWGRSNGVSRMEWLVGHFMERKFKDEIEKATTAAIISVQAAVKAQHEAFIEGEKERFRKALERVAK